MMALPQLGLEKCFLQNKLVGRCPPHLSILYTSHPPIINARLTFNVRFVDILVANSFGNEFSSYER